MEGGRRDSSSRRGCSPEVRLIDNIEPPELIMFSLGPGLEPAGESIVNELIRLTPLTVYHISTDVTVTDTQWEFFRTVAGQSELSCLCLFESTTLNDMCGTHSEDNINSKSSSNIEKEEEEEKPFFVSWGEKVRDVLLAGHVNKEVIFVVDRSLDAGLKSAPHTSSDVYDCLDYLPHPLLPFFLPLLKTRPIILLTELARYSSAQCLNRIVELLPEDENKAKRGSGAYEVAPASFTSPQPRRSTVSSPTSPPATSDSKRSSRGSVSHRGTRGSMRRLSADGGVDMANAEEEAAVRRAAFIRTYMEEKVKYVVLYMLLFSKLLQFILDCY